MSFLKKRHDEEHDSHERWLVSYADFITLLFAFFTILYATSEKNVEKTKKFERSIQKYLIKAGGAGVGGAKPSVNQAVNADSPIAQPISTFRRAKPESLKAYKVAVAFLEDHISAKDRKKYLIDVSADDLGVRLVLSTNGIYDGASAKLQPRSLPFLNHLGGLVRQMNREVMIEGHVDKGEKGRFDSPWELASMRATNLLRYIATTQKIDPRNLMSASRGDTQPLSSSHSGPGNSRIELLFLTDNEF